MKFEVYLKYLFRIVVSRDNIFKDIASLEYKKTIRCIDIPTKIVSQNDDLLSDFLFEAFN